MPELHLDGVQAGSAVQRSTSWLHICTRALRQTRQEQELHLDGVQAGIAVQCSGAGSQTGRRSERVGACPVSRSTHCEDSQHVPQEVQAAVVVQVHVVPCQAVGVQQLAARQPQLLDTRVSAGFPAAERQGVSVLQGGLQQLGLQAISTHQEDAGEGH